jgi:uncharacterized membrane protein YbhN (UPF0104 family)
MVKQTLPKKHILFWRVATTVLLLVVTGVVIAEHRQTVVASLRMARTADLRWLGAALFAMFATFLIAAALYGVLALHRLHYRQTVLVELATAFVNRLLPSGLGGLGLNGVYLYMRGHTVAEATAVVSINNLIGILAHALLLIGTLVLYPNVFKELALRSDTRISWQMAVVALVAASILAVLPVVRQRIVRFARNVWRSVHRLHATDMLAAFGLAVLLTVTYTIIVYSVAHSLGSPLTPLKAFVIFSIGMLAGTATPTPGGLIGAEAGLFAGFVAYGATDTTAGAAVLLYRLITYWLPLLPGLAALFVARRSRLV